MNDPSMEQRAAMINELTCFNVPIKILKQKHNTGVQTDPCDCHVSAGTGICFAIAHPLNVVT